MIKQLKIKEALENYSKCLKLLEEVEDIQEYLAILQNQCVCYQKIDKFDDVLSTCIRILKLVNRIESKVLEFGGKKDNPTIDKDELKKISVRTLVRRANAYIKTSQYYNAKSDLEKAYEISP
jgi:tetratricopeptide (TPR) repeat protein